ncbi:hypothetical protein HYS92_00170 [Candidatus Daviesbacteria bacterium]|nr:hypothetical protein [Candidatus Daviesbacteria bacterium]
MKPKEQISLFTFFQPEEKKEEKAHVTKNGYDFSEVTSALQKAIRASDEEAAIFWAYELSESNAWHYLLKRLCVIASEDCADPQAGLIAESTYMACTIMWGKAQATKSYYQVDMNMVGKVILYLCRTPKNRIVDISTTLIYEKRKAGWRLEVPEIAVDSHTSKGKKLIKEEGIDPNRQFYAQGAQVKNRVRIDKDQYYWDKLMEIYGLDDLVGKETEEMK